MKKRLSPFGVTVQTPAPKSQAGANHIVQQTADTLIRDISKPQLALRMYAPSSLQLPEVQEEKGNMVENIYLPPVKTTTDTQEKPSGINRFVQWLQTGKF